MTFDFAKPISYLHKGQYAKYPGNGYVLRFSNSRSETEAKLKLANDYLWLDRATRVVFIDFSLYNPNVNLFAYVRLIAEIAPTGGVYSALYVQFYFLYFWSKTQK